MNGFWEKILQTLTIIIWLAWMLNRSNHLTTRFAELILLKVVWGCIDSDLIWWLCELSACWMAIKIRVVTLYIYQFFFSLFLLELSFSRYYKLYTMVPCIYTASKITQNFSLSVSLFLYNFHIKGKLTIKDKVMGLHLLCNFILYPFVTQLFKTLTKITRWLRSVTEWCGTVVWLLNEFN